MCTQTSAPRQQPLKSDHTVSRMLPVDKIQQEARKGVQLTCIRLQSGQARPKALLATVALAVAHTKIHRAKREA